MCYIFLLLKFSYLAFVRLGFGFWFDFGSPFHVSKCCSFIRMCVVCVYTNVIVHVIVNDTLLYFHIVYFPYIYGFEPFFGMSFFNGETDTKMKFEPNNKKICREKMEKGNTPRERKLAYEMEL